MAYHVFVPVLACLAMMLSPTHALTQCINGLINDIQANPPSSNLIDRMSLFQDFNMCTITQEDYNRFSKVSGSFRDNTLSVTVVYQNEALGSRTKSYSIVQQGVNEYLQTDLESQQSFKVYPTLIDENCFCEYGCTDDPTYDDGNNFAECAFPATATQEQHAFCMSQLDALLRNYGISTVETC